MAILDRDGETTQVQGSGSKPYTLKNVGGTLSCDCPAWRNVGGPVDKRTCKHLKKVRGDASEAARIGLAGSFSQAGTTTGRVQTAVPNVAVGPNHGGKAITADPEYAATVLARAAADGRKLRQDEKAKLHGPPILLAHSFEDHDELDPKGWWLSEKLDGVRAYWDGQQFLSRQGNVFHAPDWFKAGLPAHPLDGELWMGRKAFQKTISVVKRLDWGAGAKDVQYVVFDAPHLALPFEGRMAFLAGLSLPAHVRIHQQGVCQGRQHLATELARVEALGAEGLMIRKPGSLYEAQRSHTLLKVKPFKDAEAELVGYEPGKKQHAGKVGGFVLRMPNGNQFNVNAGTEKNRVSPPKVGSRVTYRYTELTDDGIPKCASFVAVRDYE